MGIRRVKFELSRPLEDIDNIRKRKDDTDYHTRLCRLSAKFLKSQGGVGSIPKMAYITVELCTQNCEQPDVFAWNSWTSVLVEVKVSRSDFFADLKKPFRIEQKEGVGEFRYYCCPIDLIKEDEIPKNWGLLYEKDGKITLVKKANRQQACMYGERAIMTSIMRREGLKAKIYDYKEQQQTLKMKSDMKKE